VDGLLYGNPEQFGIQLLDAVVAMVYAFVVTYVIALIVEKTIGLRVDEDEEYVGTDIAQFGESLL
jgi:Amt family ammonium transporter